MSGRLFAISVFHQKCHLDTKGEDVRILNFFLLGLLFSINASAQQSSWVSDLLVVNQRLEIRGERENLILEPGTYSAEAKFKDDSIKLKLKINGQSTEVKIQTPKVDDQKSYYTEMVHKAADLKQSFDLIGFMGRVEKVTGSERTETRSCTIKSWTTQQNCHVVHRRIEGTGCNLDRSRCVIPASFEEDVECDTVTETLDGEQESTFIPSFVSDKQSIKFVDPNSGSLVAEFVLYESKFASEKTVSETRCR